VKKADEAYTAEIKEAAEAGLNKAAALTMAKIMEQENGGNIFSAFSHFLKTTLQDKESAAFVDKSINDSYQALFTESGSSLKVTQMLSQVYSKVAADGDADNLALLENYINTDFKDALNPILAEMQKGDAAFLPGAEVGTLQFKGLSGVSLAGETDIFSLNWGYKEDSTFDRSISKRFLQEDIRGVKAVKEKQDEFEENRWAALWDDTPEERRLQKEKAAKALNKSGLGRHGDDQTKARESDLPATRWERLSEERRQRKLEEAMTTKFGQLSDSSREELKKYLTDNFGEEEAEKLLEYAKWSNDLMSGLAGIHRDIRESGADEKKAESFLDFLNGTIKKEVENITSRLGDMSFDGWQASDGAPGALEAGFKFTGRDDVAKVTIMGLPGVPENTEQHGQAAISAALQKLGAGCLIDLMA
jgi:hypothetical protein